MNVNSDETFEEMLTRLGKVAQQQGMDGPSFVMAAIYQICKKLDTELNKSKLIV